MICRATVLGLSLTCQVMTDKSYLPINKMRTQEKVTSKEPFPDLTL